MVRYYNFMKIKLESLAKSTNESASLISAQLLESNHTIQHDIGEKYETITQGMATLEENIQLSYSHCMRDLKSFEKSSQDSFSSLKNKVSKCEKGIQEVIEMINDPIDL